MAETKDFSYEGEGHFKLSGLFNGQVGTEEVEYIKPDAKITDIEFLMPARVTFTSEDGEKQIRMAYVDVANKKAFDENGNPYFVDEIFTFLDEKHTLPENFFKASDEITARAAEAQQGFAPPE
jgi:hypothetical protein